MCRQASRPPIGGNLIETHTNRDLVTIKVAVRVHERVNQISGENNRTIGRPKVN